MKHVKILSAAALLALAGTANAGVTSTITATSDYDFRGLTQTDEDPALQASIDYAHDSGWYIGAWASNVDFVGPSGDDVNLEVDLYTGFTGKITDDLSWDVGIIHYAYPDDSDVNTTEVYAGLGYKWLKGKISYSPDVASSDEDSIYIEGNASIPLPANFSILAHVGHMDIANADYTDYSIGVGYTISNFNLSVKYVDTDIDNAETDRVIFTVSTTLPWAQ